MKHLTVKQKCNFVTLDRGCQSGFKCNIHKVGVKRILEFCKTKKTDKIKNSMQTFKETESNDFF